MASSAAELDYPWFTLVEGDQMEQGDILESCPVFSPPNELAEHDLEPDARVPFDCDRPDVIVMSQSCDLEKGREKVEEVLFCGVWQLSDFTEGTFSKLDDWENARRGRFPAYHVLAGCELPGNKREPRVVDFRRVYSLPLGFVRTRAAAASRIRLMPPYREHLSQAFARFFMRVGLPSDIPSFRQG